MSVTTVVTEIALQIFLSENASIFKTNLQKFSVF
jgi:hypothetical protein